MGKLLSQREQMNLPFGMNELDLMIYSPPLYEMYRNEGQGYDKEAFRWDPIVSKGMLASEFAVADGLWWTMLLTPEAQMQINPGDNLVVPVETYDDYRQLPPVEKYLTSDVSYTGRGKVINNRDILNANNSFCGDFNGYFNQESNAIGEVSAEQVMPISTPRTVSPLVEAGQIEVGIVAPRETSTPITPKYRCIPVAPYCVRDDVNGNKTSCATCPTGVAVVGPSGPSTGTGQGSGSGSGTGTGEGSGSGNPPICDWSFGEWGPCQNGSQTRELFLSPAGCIPVGRPILSQSCESGTGGGTGTGGETGTGGNGEVESGGELPPMGGGGGGFGGGGGGEAPAEEATGAKEGSTTPVVCKMDYKPVIIGIIAGLAVGYLYAKNKNKDVKLFSGVVAIIGGILGFVYAKHQCKPIGVLTKLKVPSKVNAPATTPAPKTEAKYYGGR